MLIRLRILIAATLLRLAGRITVAPDAIPDDLRVSVTADAQSIIIETAGAPLIFPWSHVHLVLTVLDDVRLQIYRLWLAHEITQEAS